MNSDKTIEELQQDFAEAENLLSQAQRPRLQKLLQDELSRLRVSIDLERNRAPRPEAPQKTQPAPAANEGVHYSTLTKYSFENESDHVKVYILLDGIGEVGKEGVKCDFTERSFDLKIHGYQGKNWRMIIRNLCGDIVPGTSELRLKKNSIVLILKKSGTKYWDSLVYKENALKPESLGKDKNEDPQQGLMNMMKKLYEEGDEDMKRTIAQAWV
eukprot:TRINITY_DN2018_c0_g1_i2.p1 TRINITY_DN2018_c0_g1~~TRINITY_DN2018_c0_g1_i2.p1  ORF type:complete len:214 (-),score=53.59 TRINITY_DN2018_c0_g1_i2:83-724(-)